MATATKNDSSTPYVVQRHYPTSNTWRKISGLDSRTWGLADVRMRRYSRVQNPGAQLRVWNASTREVLSTS